MHDVNWWLMTLAFLLGLVLTFALMIRKVTREVPVSRTVSAAVKTPEVRKVAGTAAAAVATGAVAKKVVDKVERVEKVVHDKVDDVLERDPYGAGSIRVSARSVAPVGYTIKGDKDTMRYFSLESPDYQAIEAEVWFANEASAEKAGFLRWDAKAGTHVVDSAVDAAKTIVTGGTITPASAAVVVTGGTTIPEGTSAVVHESAITSTSATKFVSSADVPAGPYGKGSAKADASGSGPAGWLIKGNADSMLFHGTDSPAYEQTIAEVWFFDEETARAAGFDKWDKNFR